jgi:probable HAF family extracellular repeat protein
MSAKPSTFLATILVALSMPVAHANRYSIEDIGHNVIPFDVNTSGVVVAFRNDKAVEFRNGHWHALPIAGHAGIVRALNERGDAVGNQGITPILWTASGGRQALALPDGATSGTATGVTSDRIAAGRFTPPDAFFDTHCFRTLPDGTSTDLGLLAQGNDCAANGINERGDIVGEANVVADGPTHAILWRDGALRDLGMLGAGDMSRALAINGKGLIVGRSNLAPGGASHAFVLKQGAMRDIGSSPDFSDTSANAINDRGEIVGDGAHVADGAFHALRFEGGAVVALEDEVDDLGDWLLLSATSVNEEGVIVGEGVRLGDGRVHGFLLRPLP